jgi:hypothetical protein
MDVALVPEEMASSLDVPRRGVQRFAHLQNRRLLADPRHGRRPLPSVKRVHRRRSRLGRRVLPRWPRRQRERRPRLGVRHAPDPASPEDKDGSDGGAVRAHIDFGLVDQRRSPPVIKEESWLSYSFASQGASAGYAEVGSSGLVHGYCLAVCCMVHVVRLREGDVAGAAAAVRHAGWARLSAGALSQEPDGLRQRKAAPRRGRRRLQTQGQMPLLLQSVKMKGINYP